MNNKGRIVVFISMITAVMLVLITLVIQVVILSAAGSKNVIATPPFHVGYQSLLQQLHI